MSDSNATAHGHSSLVECRSFPLALSRAATRDARHTCSTIGLNDFSPTDSVALSLPPSIRQKDELRLHTAGETELDRFTLSPPPISLSLLYVVEVAVQANHADCALTLCVQILEEQEADQDHDQSKLTKEVCAVAYPCVKMRHAFLSCNLLQGSWVDTDVRGLVALAGSRTSFRGHPRNSSTGRSLRI